MNVPSMCIDTQIQAVEKKSRTTQRERSRNSTEIPSHTNAPVFFVSSGFGKNNLPVFSLKLDTIVRFSNSPAPNVDTYMDNNHKIQQFSTSKTCNKNSKNWIYLILMYHDQSKKGNDQAGACPMWQWYGCSDLKF